MKYSPPPKNKKAQNSCLILLISSVLIFFLASTGYAKGAAVLQLIGVIFLAASTYFMLRAMTFFTYIITENKESEENACKRKKLTLTVSKRLGNKGREAYQCVLDLSLLKKVKTLPCDGAKRKEALSSLEKMNIYRYVKTVGKCESVILIFGERGRQSTGLILELSEEMTDFFKNICRENLKFNEDDTQGL